MDQIVAPGLALDGVIRQRQRVGKMAWSPDGSLLATSTASEIAVWDPAPIFTYAAPDRVTIWSFAWSPDGREIAIACDDELVVMNLGGKPYKRARAHRARIYAVAWCPSGELLATASADHTVRIWDPSLTSATVLTAHKRPVYAIAWSPDGSQLASASKDKTVVLSDPRDWSVLRVLQGHAGWVADVAWSPDGSTVASASGDGTIRIWDAAADRNSAILEGHTDGVYSVAFSSDGALIVSTAADHTARLWDARDHRCVATVPQPQADYGYYWPAGAVFHPSQLRSAMLGRTDSEVAVYTIDRDGLSPSLETAVIRYASAKVVLLGDSGVGKSGLAQVLAGESFKETDSTHGRSVRTLSSRQVSLNGVSVLREVLLWDLAGQPGYRALHALSLTGMALAVVVFDARYADTTSVEYWMRVARRWSGDFEQETPIVLVCARSDIGSGAPVMRELTGESGVAGLLYVSAKTGEGVAELRDFIEGAIPWYRLPTVTTTPRLQRIRTFLLQEKAAGRQLATVDQLFRAFNTSGGSDSDAARQEFETGLRFMSSSGLVEVLGTSNQVLLQPELLDHYAEAFLRAAREEPNGLGTIRVADILAGSPIPAQWRVADEQLHNILLAKAMEVILQREIALMEGTGDTACLLFPSEIRREQPHTDAPADLTYRFRGTVSEIYASLVVRLQYSEVFRRTAIWRNAIEYAAPGGGTCCLTLRQLPDDRGELELSFNDVPVATRSFFEELVRSTLQKRVLRDSIERRRTVTCPTCGTVHREEIVAARLARGATYLTCPVCDTRISLVESHDYAAAEAIPAFEHSVEVGRERSEAAALIQRKLAAGDFDVYVSYSNADIEAVVRITNSLRTAGLLPWIMEEQVNPGDRWTLTMVEQIARAKAFAVFIGSHGAGRNQAYEIDRIVAEAQNRRVPIIPVLLPDVSDVSVVPMALREYVWVDFRQLQPDPLELLGRGIAGARGSIAAPPLLEKRARPETDLLRALESAENARDWMAARQFLIELTQLARSEDRRDATVFAKRALMMADNPLELDGSGLREPLELLVDIDPAVLEGWLPRAYHRDAVLRELRDIAVRRPEVFDLLKRTGIQRWMEWLESADPARIGTLPRAGQGWPAVRLRRLRLRNVKSFSDVSFGFLRDGRPDSVVTFVGDNATGKSTLLQSIVLACLGSSFAAKVETISAQTLLRNGASNGSIEVELELAVDPSATPFERGIVCLGLAMDDTRKDLYALPDEQMTLGTVNHMPAWDVLRGQVGLQWGYCGGYGAFRALRERRDPLAASGQGSVEIDRVLSLFQPQATLIEPALLESILQADVSALSRDPSRIPLGVRDAIAAVFRNTIPGVETLEVNGRWRIVETDSGVSSLVALSDGCNSMIALIGHMIRHTLELRGWVEDPTRAEGIVVIDEVDLHLHPSWQREAIPQLAAVFPSLQFIVTTHSPVVLGGVPDSIIGVLGRTEEGETVIDVGPTVKGWRVDQLLTGVHFDLDSVYDSDTEALRAEYGRKLSELGSKHPLVLMLDEQLRKQLRDPLSSTNPDRDLAALLDEFLAYRLGKLSETERQQTFARMWEILRQ